MYLGKSSKYSLRECFLSKTDFIGKICFCSKYSLQKIFLIKNVFCRKICFCSKPQQPHIKHTESSPKPDYPLKKKKNTSTAANRIKSFKPCPNSAKKDSPNSARKRLKLSKKTLQNAEKHNKTLRTPEKHSKTHKCDKNNKSRQKCKKIVTWH